MQGQLTSGALAPLSNGLNLLFQKGDLTGKELRYPTYASSKVKKNHLVQRWSPSGAGAKKSCASHNEKSLLWRCA